MAMGSFEWMEVEALSGEIAALDARLAQARARHNHGLVKVLREEIASAQQRRAKYLANISTSLANSLEPDPPPKADASDKKATKDNAKTPEPEPEVVEPEPEVAELAAEAEPDAAPDDEPEPAEEEEEILVSEQPEEVVAEAEEEIAAEETAAEVETAVAEEPEPADEIVAEAEEDTAVVEEPEPAEEIVAEAAVAPVAAEPVTKDAPAPKRGEATSSSNALPGVDATMGVSAVWNQLSVSDIEQAKRQLDIRRSEMLARHAEEMKALEADQVQIDALAQAIEAFVRKFSAPADDASVVRLDEKRQQA